MADPVIKACPEGVWTIVAPSVLNGIIHVLKTGVLYVQTYRDTGGAAPSDASEEVPFNSELQIASSAAIDVYVKSKGGDGSVRVDL